MSATPYELLLWSHYADNHRGFCVQYERCSENVLGQKAVRVTYTKKRPVSLLQTLVANRTLPRCIEVVVTSKAPNWAYEKEWRLVCPGVEDEAMWFQLEGPPPGARIQSVILGLRMGKDHADTLVAAFREPRDIKFYKMNMHPERYELVPVPVEVDWERFEVRL